jgi:hypothetical protein
VKYTIWGSVLSPFSLKVRAMCDFAHVDYDWLPGDNRRVQRLKAGRLPLTYPLRDELDEYPLVPFLFADDGSNLYDSTAIAHWLDHHHGTDSRRTSTSLGSTSRTTIAGLPRRRTTTLANGLQTKWQSRCQPSGGGDSLNGSRGGRYDAFPTCSAWHPTGTGWRVCPGA